MKVFSIEAAMCWWVLMILCHFSIIYNNDKQEWLWQILILNKPYTIYGKKELLGLYLCESEGASNWLSVLTYLQNRGVKDILIACIDGLSGSQDVIASIYPNTKIELSIIHQIRNSMKSVASKNQKAFMADLKPVYRATSLNAAELALDQLEVKWADT